MRRVFLHLLFLDKHRRKVYFTCHKIARSHPLCPHTACRRIPVRCDVGLVAKNVGKVGPSLSHHRFLFLILRIFLYFIKSNSTSKQLQVDVTPVPEQMPCPLHRSALSHWNWGQSYASMRKSKKDAGVLAEQPSLQLESQAASKWPDLTTV